MPFSLMSPGVVAVLLILFLITHLSEGQQFGLRFFDLNPDIFRDSAQLIRSRGFDAERHRITTKDGYILTVFRIVNRYLRPDQRPSSGRLRPVILMHGVGVTSDSWLFSTAGHINSTGSYIENDKLVNECERNATDTLGYTLAACGYDVWLPNARGTVYSQGHTRYNAEIDPRYWQFSLTEMAIFDIPAVISYVLRHTGEKSLAYVGHSLGTDLMFALQSLMPEIGQLVRPFIALAPVAYVGNIWSSARLGVPLEPLLKQFPGPFGVSPALMQIVGAFICGNDLLVNLCADVLFTINGFDSVNFNRSIVPVNVAHSAASSSTWLYAHLAQLVATKTYRMMDFGPPENLRRYGAAMPPAYPLANISSPDIALFRGENDPLADIKDVDRLVNSLSVNLLDNYLVPYPKWNHQDFQLGISQGFYVNTRLVRLLRQYD